MDFIDALPNSKGKTTIFVVLIDCPNIAILFHTQLQALLKYSLNKFLNYMACQKVLCVIETQHSRACFGGSYSGYKELALISALLITCKLTAKRR